jgi:ubiquinone/menaquinone biosynthesis C-methylase UbiE
MTTTFDEIHESPFQGWGVSFRRSQLFRYKLYQNILKRLNVKGPVLEIGCSTGFFTAKYLHPLSKNRLVACDISNAAINMARSKYPHIRFDLAALPQTQFNDDQFDIITVLEVLNYLTPKNQYRSMDELWRITRNDGYILISVKIADTPYFSIEEIKALVCRKFQIIKTEATYIKTYFDIIETFVWRLLILVSERSKIGISPEDTGSRKMLKHTVNLFIKNKMAFLTYGLLINLVCKGFLYVAPIRMINFVSKQLNPNKEINRFIILAKKTASE